MVAAHVILVSSTCLVKNLLFMKETLFLLSQLTYLLREYHVVHFL